MISLSEAPSEHAILHNIGRVHFLAGNYHDAIKAYSRTLADLGPQGLNAEEFTVEKEPSSDIDSFRTAVALNCIGVCRLRSHHDDDVVTYPLDKTLLLFHKALSIFDKVEHTSRSMALAKTNIINNIGRALFQQEGYSPCTPRPANYAHIF